MIDIKHSKREYDDICYYDVHYSNVKINKFTKNYSNVIFFICVFFCIVALCLCETWLFKMSISLFIVSHTFIYIMRRDIQKLHRYNTTKFKSKLYELDFINKL